MLRERERDHGRKDKALYSGTFNDKLLTAF